MKGKFTKFRKLLCYVIISLFMFGIGGEFVKADSIIINNLEWLGNYQTARYAKFNVTLNGQARYAYCLDAPLDAPGAGNTLSNWNPNLSEETKLRMINVLVAAGYPQYDLYYTSGGKMSDQDAFYVTQAALWYARYGSAATYRTFTPNFHLKMKNGTNGLYEYRDAYRKLIGAADSKNAYDRKVVELELNASEGNAMSEATIGSNRVLVSDSTFSVSDHNNNKNTAYTVNVTGTNASIYSEDLSENYGTGKALTENDKFRIVIDVDDSASASQYEASFIVRETRSGTDYELAFFAGAWSGGFQSMTLLVSKPYPSSEISFSLNGNTEDHEYDIPFAKIGRNKEGQDVYVGSAELEIYNSNDQLVASIQTNGEGEEPVRVRLVAGDYYLKEFINPSGYTMNNTTVPFTVGNDGSLTSGGETVSIVSMSDETSYIALKKVDPSGNPVEGAYMLVYSRTGDSYVCGVTNAQGYVVADTQNGSICSASSLNSNYSSELGVTFTGKTNIVNTTGIYSLVDLDYSNFYSFNQHYVKELRPAYGYDENNDVYGIAGQLGNSIGWYFNHEDYMAGSAGDITQQTQGGITYTEFQFVNNRYIYIDKVDSLGGQEVPGATLQICRKVNKDEVNGACEVDSTNNTVYVDYWISESEAHKFVGIEKGVRYILEEVYAPEGYILFSGMLEFELVDDEGTVKMYNHTTGEEITNPEALKAVMPNEPSTEVNISKVDAAGGQEIPGAEIKICTEDAYNTALATTGDGNNCDAIESWTSGTSAHTVTGLEYGSYYLIETVAPAGYYSKTSATKFTLDVDNKVKSVTLENEVTKLTIIKKDQVTGDRIAGAKLEIIDLETDEIARDYKGNELVWETKADQDWEILGIPAGRYKLIETITPEGYQEGMIIDGQVVNEYEFTIGNKEGDVNINLNLEVLNAPNTGISTLNLFAIGGLMVFAGYETIKIYRRKALNN